jgi:hypothetical protein
VRRARGAVARRARAGTAQDVPGDGRADGGDQQRQGAGDREELGGDDAQHEELEEREEEAHRALTSPFRSNRILSAAAAPDNGPSRPGEGRRGGRRPEKSADTPPGLLSLHVNL